MTTLREAAQQALEILERLHGGCTDSDDGTVEAITIWVPEIIDALRAALAEPQGCDHCNHPLYAATKCRVCGRVTEPAQEPAAWIEHEWAGTGLRKLHFEKRDPTVRDEVVNPVWTPLYTAPPQTAEPVQEPVRNHYESDLDMVKCRQIAREYAWPDSGIDAGNLYWALHVALRRIDAAQPQRKPLTSDKDRPDNGATYVEGYGYVDTRAVRAIERAHNIKE